MFNKDLMSLYLCCFCLSRKNNLTFLFRNKCGRKEAVICMLSLLYSLSINSLPGSSGCCSLSDGFYTPKSHQADSIRFPYFRGRRRKSLGCGRVDMKKTFLGIFLVRAVWKPSRAFFYFLGLQTTLAGIDDSGDRAGGIGRPKGASPADSFLSDRFIDAFQRRWAHKWTKGPSDDDESGPCTEPKAGKKAVTYLTQILASNATLGRLADD